LLGSGIAPVVFAIALIAAGQSSTVTGTLAGQIVMEGYLKLHINPMLRRLITRLLAIVPAVIVISFYGEEEVNDLLIFSQVVLSMQLGFAVVPLIHFVSDKKTMGQFVINPVVKVLAWLVAVVLVALNVNLLYHAALSFFNTSDNVFWKIIIIGGAGSLAFLLGYIVVYPYIPKIHSMQSHEEIIQEEQND
jgi:manganese transport protein